MNIDPKKVQLAERDIEDWLWDNPTDLDLPGGEYIERWIGRQYKVPSGIIDLIGITNEDDCVIVEIKNKEIDAEALAQVKRYHMDIRNIIEGYAISQRAYMKPIYSVVVGKGNVGNEIMFEAEAMEITLVTFNVSLQLEVSKPWRWKPEFVKQRQEEYASSSHHELLSEFAWETAHFLFQDNQTEQSAQEIEIKPEAENTEDESEAG